MIIYDDNKIEINVGDIIIWEDNESGKNVGIVQYDEKYTDCKMCLGRSLKNIWENSKSIRVVK